MRQQIQVEVDRLKKVLHQLTKQGFLEKVGVGEKARYRLKAKTGEPHFEEDSSREAVSKKQNGNED